MIDHTGVAATNYAKSKQFYTQALAPLGYQLMMELPKEVPTAAASQVSACRRNPTSGSQSMRQRTSPRCTSRSAPTRARSSMLSTKLRWQQAAATTAARARARTTTRSTTARSCWIQTATTSRLCCHV